MGHLGPAWSQLEPVQAHLAAKGHVGGHQNSQVPIFAANLHDLELIPGSAGSVGSVGFGP